MHKNWGNILFFEKDLDKRENEFYNKRALFAEKYENNQIIMQRPLFEDGIDIIIAQNISVDIIHKIKNKKGFIGLSTIATGRNPFGIVGKESTLIKISKDSFFENSVKLYCAHETIKYVDVNTVTKGIGILKSYKVFTSKANGGAGLLGDDKLVQIIGKSYVALPMEACTDSLIAIGTYQTYEEAVNLQKYMTTKFLRYLAGVLKTSQNLYQGIYQFVPIQDFTNNSDIDWSKSINEIDKQLYNKYGLTQDEIEFIENKIKPME